MIYNPELDIHIRNKIKVKLELSNYTIKRESQHATGVDTYDLTTKRDFIALKADVEQLDINKLVNVSTSFNNLKLNIDDLDVRKLKTVSINLKKIDQVVDKKS